MVLEQEHSNKEVMGIEGMVLLEIKVENHMEITNKKKKIMD